MSRFSKSLICLPALAALALSSCSDDNPWHGSEDEGGINLNLSTDGRVMRQTRADDSLSPVVPAGELFAVNLSKSDGSYSKDWSSLEGFNRESAFPIGDYTLTATYGDLEAEGFSNPYYKGSTDVHVSPGAETDARVVATLANAMVSIRYTDQFISNFPAYSAAVQTEGHDWVIFAQDETRPAYIAPSEVKLNLTLTNFNGERVTIQPAGFTAVARHHYVVTIGVDGSSGDLRLDVVFDDDVVAETVNVSLGDDLFSAPAPSVTAKGFDPQVTVESFEYAARADKPQFHVFAFGGLKEATLNVVSANGYSPAFGRSVQLVNADALTQQQLAAAGVDCSGFFRNVDKMGVVDVTGFLSSLPAGSYTVELQAVDAMTRTSEPLKLSAVIKPVELEFASSHAAVDYLATEVTVDINSNCPDIKNSLKFKAPDSQNRMIDATVKSVEQIQAAGSLPYTFRYVLSVQPQTGASVDVQASLGTRTISTSVPVNAPDYTIEADAFSNRVVLRVNAADDATTKSIFDRLRFYNNGTEIPSANIAHSTSSNLVTISGLAPGVSYVALTARVGTFEKPVPQFTTESETDVTNGNFSAITKTIDINPINTGGKYSGVAGTVITYQLISSIVRSTPNSWANINEKTCYTGSSNMNTWFVVPSTYTLNGQTVIESVGYSHNGKSPNAYGETAVYYCKNSPADADLEKAAGELFLGSYSFNGSESRTDGIAWSSRPASLSFDYSYSSYNNEKGEAYIKILDASGKVLASQTLQLAASSSMIPRTVSLSGYPFGAKAAKIVLGFRSTQSGVTPAVHIPSGSELQETAVYWLTFTNPGGHPVAENAYKAVAKGSKLVIDNVKLGYDVRTSSQAPRRSGRR